MIETVVVRGAFAPAWLARVAALDGGSPPIDGPLAEPTLLAHPQLGPILAATLGEGYIMGRLAIGRAVGDVLADLPDRANLFGDPTITARVPAIGLALYVALAASTVRLATDATTRVLAAGDCVVVDTRTRISADGGPALLVVYYRHWFRDGVAPIDQPPVTISPWTLRRIPRPQRHLFAWRIDRYWRIRPRLLVDRGVRRLPGPVVTVVTVVRRLLGGRRG